MAKTKKTRIRMKPLLHEMKTIKRRYIVGLIFISIVMGLSPSISILLLNEAINLIFLAAWMNTALLIAVYIILQALSQVLGLAQGYMNTAISLCFSEQIENKIAHTIRNTDIEAYDNSDFYNSYSLAIEQISFSPLSMVQLLSGVATQSISIVGFVSVLAAINIYVALIMILFGIPSFIIAIKNQRDNYNLTVSQSSNYRKKKYIFDVLTSLIYIKESKIFNFFDGLMAEKKSIFRTLFKEELKLQKTIATRAIVSELVVYSSIGAALVLVFISNREVLQFNFLTVFMAMASFSLGISGITSTVSRLYQSFSFFELYNKFIDLCKSHTRTHKAKNASITSVETIDFNNVSFRYPHSTKMIINNLSLALHKGDSLLLVGENGIGKSTFIKLLTGFYLPTNGKIKLNDVDINFIKTEDIYKHFTCIFQDFAKYAIPLKENVQFFSNVDGSAQALKISLEQATALSFVKKLPKGVDTNLTKMFDDFGIEPSQGQWQKIAIARALYKQADVYVFDEATAFLDQESEHKVLEHLHSLASNAITVIASHRISIANNVSYVLFFESNNRACFGTHQQLYDSNSEYRLLYDKE